jgi:lysylphosphatidylglycerol synthase-like protein
VGAGGSSLVLVMVAYIAGMSASGLSLLPGGLGVVDAAMIFALTQGGVSTTLATAGVLLYRLISFALVVSLGWIIWAATWFAERNRATGGVEPAPAEVVPVDDRLPSRDLGYAGVYF